MSEYKYAKIIVTGANGMLGKNLVEYLSNKYYKKVQPIFRSQYDLKDAYQCNKLFENHNPDVLINCAGNVGGIGFNMQVPGDLFWDNMLICGNMITAASQQRDRVSKFIQVGTTCSYPAFAPIPFSETSLYDGEPEKTNSAYGISKLAILKYMQARRDQNGLNGTYVIPTNMVGRYDHFDHKAHVIPDLIKKFVTANNVVDGSEKVVTIYGDGTPTRDFIDVRDCANAIECIMNHYNDREPINIGTGMEFPISDIVQIIKNITKFDGSIEYNKDKPNGQQRRSLNIDKLKDMGWSHKYSIVESIQNCYNYYIERYSK